MFLYLNFHFTFTLYVHTSNHAPRKTPTHSSERGFLSGISIKWNESKTQISLLETFQAICCGIIPCINLSVGSIRPRELDERILEPCLSVCWHFRDGTENYSLSSWYSNSEGNSSLARARIICKFNRYTLINDVLLLTILYWNKSNVVPLFSLYSAIDRHFIGPWTLSVCEHGNTLKHDWNSLALRNYQSLYMEYKYLNMFVTWVYTSTGATRTRKSLSGIEILYDFTVYLSLACHGRAKR